MVGLPINRTPRRRDGGPLQPLSHAPDASAFPGPDRKGFTIERSRPSGPFVWLATAGGAGYLPLAPGTWGSFLALVLFPLVARLDLAAYLVLAAAVTVLGTVAATRAERAFGRKDDGRIVIDEVAGQLVTLAPLVPLRAELSAAGPWLGVSPLLWLAVTGFVAFRVFDVWKPGPARWCQERFAGGLGVMADDVVAGAMGAVAMTVVAVGALGFDGGAAR